MVYAKQTCFVLSHASSSQREKRLTEPHSDNVYQFESAIEQPETSDVLRDSRRQRNIAILALVMVNALWGLSFPMMKSLNQQIDLHFGVELDTASSALRIASASWMIAIRFALALLLMILLMRPMIRRATRVEWIAGTLIAVFFYVGLVLQLIGLATIPASRSGFLTSLTAVFTPLFSSLVLRKQPTIGAWCGVVLALLGVSVLTGLVIFTDRGMAIAPDAMEVWQVGDTLTTLGAVFFTGQLLLVDYFGKRIDTAAATPGMFVTVVVLSCVTFAVVSAFVPEESMPGGWISLSMQPQFIGMILFLGVFCSLVCFYCMNKYQPYISAVQASVIYSLEPVFASSWALVIPGLLSIATGIAYENEQWSLPLVFGGSLILMANVVSLWPSNADRSVKE